MRVSDNTIVGQTNVTVNQRLVKVSYLHINGSKDGMGERATKRARESVSCVERYAC